MTRDEILSTTRRIRDLHYFYDILTSDTPGAERAWEAMDDLSFPNPMALTSYLLENKDFFLRYCDDEGSRIRTARTTLLMYAASLEGRSKAKDDRLTDIVDNKIKIYNFEWNDACKNSAAAAIDVLKDLPLEDKVDIIEDVKSIFEVEGDITEKQQGLIDRLKESFGIGEGELDDEDDTEEEQPGSVKTEYVFTHPGKCKYMPQRLMEATYTDILTRLRLDDYDKREAFLAMDRREAGDLIYKTYRDVAGNASPSLMKIVEKEGQGELDSHMDQFIENMVSRIYDSLKNLRAENGDGILYPDANLLEALPFLDQVMSSAGFLQENMECDEIDAGSVQYLKIVGTIGAPDFRFLREECPHLEVLDISDALICDYEGQDGPDGNITYYNSLEIPLGAFCYGMLRDGKAGHQNLTIILFHEDTYAIQRAAFYGCSKLDKVFLPDKMEVIDEKAFRECESLEYVYLGGTMLVKNGAFFGCKALKDIVCPGNPPALGNPNQSPEMKRFATPVFSPHEMDGTGLEVRAIYVPDSKEAAYEKSEWKDVSQIFGDSLPGMDNLNHGRDFFEMVLDSHFEGMARRDIGVAKMTFLTSALWDDENGGFSDSAWATIVDLVKFKIPISRDTFDDMLRNPDPEKAARLLEGMDTDEWRDFIQDFHSAITKEGIGKEGINVLRYALFHLDDEQRRDVLGDLVDIYYPELSNSESVHEESGDDDIAETTETEETEDIPDNDPKSAEPESKEVEKKEKTSNVKDIPESWSVIGSFNSWSKDIVMTKVMDGIWVSPWIPCSAGDAFKVRCNGSWDNNLGGLFSEFGKAFKAVPNGDNIIVPSTGKFIVTLNTKENVFILTKENGPVEEEEKKTSSVKPAAKVLSDSGESISPGYKENLTCSSGDEKTVEFKKIWLTYYKNIFSVHIHFQVNHAANQKGKLTVWLYNEDGSKLMAGIYGERTPDGQVAKECEITPQNDFSEWIDWWNTYFGFNSLNMPAPGTYRFKLKVGVTFDGVTLPCSDFVDFKVEYKKSLLGDKFKLI